MSLVSLMIVFYFLTFVHADTLHVNINICTDDVIFLV